MAMIRDGNGNVIDSSNPLQVNTTTNDIIPVDIQARLSQTIQTHSGTTVINGTPNNGSWIDTEGFEKVVVTFMNSGSTPSQINVLWSHDGATQHGLDQTANDSIRFKKLDLATSGRYILVQIANNHTAPVTASAWAYLKA